MAGVGASQRAQGAARDAMEKIIQQIGGDFGLRYLAPFAGLSDLCDTLLSI